jgi:hypothetical protein
LKTTGVLSIVNGVPINAAANKLLMLLSSIEREQPNVLIKKGELKRLAPGQFSPQRVGPKQKPKKKSKLPIKLPKWEPKTKTLLVVGILALLISFTYSAFSDSKEDSPLSQVTSWQNPQADEWAVYLRSFQTLEDAKLEQGAFSNRPISIFRFDNGKFYLFVLTESESEAQRELTSTVKKRWRKSRVIPFDRCSRKLIRAEGYYVCE